MKLEPMTYLQQKKPYVAPGFKSNVKHLEGYIKYAPSKEYQDKIKDVINLYKDKKIRNFKTADNVIRDLTHARLIKSGKANSNYESVVAKYRNVEPMTGRLEREALVEKAKQVEEAIKKKQPKKHTQEQQAKLAKLMKLAKVAKKRYTKR